MCYIVSDLFVIVSECKQVNTKPQSIEQLNYVQKSEYNILK